MLVVELQHGRVDYTSQTRRDMPFVTLYIGNNYEMAEWIFKRTSKQRRPGDTITFWGDVNSSLPIIAESRDG